MPDPSPVSLPGLRSPGAGFEDPFGMLAACHERVQRSLDLLSRLLDHLQSNGLDDDARSAAHDVWRYFEIAAPAHHADEERHVLPRLRQTGDPWLAAVAGRIDADHRALRAVWSRLGPLLHGMHEGPVTLTTDLLRVLQPEAAAFIAIHERHVPLEDRLAFPPVRERMRAEEVRAMGEEMAGRRRPA